MQPFIYFRALKLAEHTVFCVEKGQKTYRDPQFGRTLAYSSGQQVKRSILDAITTALNVPFSPTTFIFNLSAKSELGEGEAYGVCDPSYPDQLIGGWMKAEGGGNNKTLKRRSPLSISAMRPLHPLLASNVKEDLTFDRSDKPHLHKVVVRDSKGNELSETEVEELLSGTARSVHRKWVPDNTRATGLFVYDVAIDLRTLFAISLSQFEPEVTSQTIDKLKAEGWGESENAFGKCLIVPKEKREQLIPAIAHALIHWQLGSNQSRTFSLRETLAIAISDNANKIAGAIRAKLKEDEDKAIPIVDDTISGVSTYITPQGAGRIRTNTESADALEQAEQKLIELIKSFNYEQQLATV